MIYINEDIFINIQIIKYVSYTKTENALQIGVVNKKEKNTLFAICASEF